MLWDEGGGSRQRSRSGWAAIAGSIPGMRGRSVRVALRSATNLTTLGFGKRSKSAPNLLPPVSGGRPADPFNLLDQEKRHVFIFSAVDARSEQLSALVSATVHPLPRPAQTQTRAGHRGSVARSWEPFNAVERSSERRAAPTRLPTAQPKLLPRVLRSPRKVQSTGRRHRAPIFIRSRPLQSALRCHNSPTVRTSPTAVAADPALYPRPPPPHDHPPPPRSELSLGLMPRRD